MFNQDEIYFIKAIYSKFLSLKEEFDVLEKYQGREEALEDIEEYLTIKVCGGNTSNIDLGKIFEFFTMFEDFTQRLIQFHGFYLSPITYIGSVKKDPETYDTLKVCFNFENFYCDDGEDVYFLLDTYVSLLKKAVEGLNKQEEETADNQKAS